MDKKLYIILIPVFLMVIGQTSSKYGMMISEKSSLFVLFLAIGYITLILRGFVWIYILKKIELSRAYPLVSISYVFVILISIFVFKEPISLLKIFGAIFITIGTSIISTS